MPFRAERLEQAGGGGEFFAGGEAAFGDEDGAVGAADGVFGEGGGEQGRRVDEDHVVVALEPVEALEGEAVGGGAVLAGRFGEAEIGVDGGVDRTPAIHLLEVAFGAEEGFRGEPEGVVAEVLELCLHAEDEFFHVGVRAGGGEDEGAGAIAEEGGFDAAGHAEQTPVGESVRDVRGGGKHGHGADTEDLFEVDGEEDAAVLAMGEDGGEQAAASRPSGMAPRRARRRLLETAGDAWSGATARRTRLGLLAWRRVVAMESRTVPRRVWRRLMSLLRAE